MTGFYIGMLAFALWVGVMVGIYHSVKANPGHPFWSMARFKNARRSIAPALTPPVSHEPLELSIPEAEPAQVVESTDLDLERVSPVLTPPPDSDLLVLREPEQEQEELQELEAMLSSISAPKKPRAPRPPRKRATGPVRSGRLTYVLVDDEGRPEL